MRFVRRAAWSPAYRRPHARGEAAQRVGINAAGVIDPDALEEDFFDQTLSDVLTYAVNGMNGCVLVMGASDSGKTEFLHSSNMGSGIVYHVRKAGAPLHLARPRRPAARPPPSCRP